MTNSDRKICDGRFAFEQARHLKPSVDHLIIETQNDSHSASLMYIDMFEVTSEDS